MSRGAHAAGSTASHAMQSNQRRGWAPVGGGSGGRWPRRTLAGRDWRRVFNDHQGRLRLMAGKFSDQLGRSAQGRCSRISLQVLAEARNIQVRQRATAQQSWRACSSLHGPAGR